jgi:hypothetical protein
VNRSRILVCLRFFQIQSLIADVACELLRHTNPPARMNVRFWPIIGSYKSDFQAFFAHTNTKSIMYLQTPPGTPALGTDFKNSASILSRQCLSTVTTAEFQDVTSPFFNDGQRFPSCRRYAHLPEAGHVWEIYPRSVFLLAFICSGFTCPRGGVDFHCLWVDMLMRSVRSRGKPLMQLVHADTSSHLDLLRAIGS